MLAVDARIAASCLLAAVMSTAHAGLDLQSMQQRHDALAAGDPGPGIWPGELDIDYNRATVTTQLGGRPTRSPALLGETITGGGARVTARALAADDNRYGIEARFGLTARLDDDDPQPEGTHLGIRLGPGEAYASYTRRHWGPGWFGSLILDGSAPPLAAAGWHGGTRYAADASLGIDLFAGVLSGYAPPVEHPKLIGMRGEWRPNPSWTIGLARTMQWGGNDRNETLRNLFRALLGRDNENDAQLGNGNEPGNQMAGGDIRYNFGRIGGVAPGVYLQMIGEDFTGTVPSRQLRLLGTDLGWTWGSLQLRGILEATRTSAGKTPGLAYRHHLYPVGYTDRGQLLGHPVGGDARLASLGLIAERGPAFALLALHGGTALAGSQRFTPGDRLRGADLALSIAPQPRLNLGFALHYWSAGAESDRWAQFTVRYTWP
jgi:hypothetical protein